MKKTTLATVLLLSAMMAAPASANWFFRPDVGVGLNVGSAPNPTPNDLRVLYGPLRYGVTRVSVAVQGAAHLRFLQSEALLKLIDHSLPQLLSERRLAAAEQHEDSSQQRDTAAMPSMLKRAHEVPCAQVRSQSREAGDHRSVHGRAAIPASDVWFARHPYSSVDTHSPESLQWTAGAQ